MWGKGRVGGGNIEGVAGGSDGREGGGREEGGRREGGGEGSEHFSGQFVACIKEVGQPSY